MASAHRRVMDAVWWAATSTITPPDGSRRPQRTATRQLRMTLVSFAYRPDCLDAAPNGMVNGAAPPADPSSASGGMKGLHEQGGPP